MQTTKKHVAYYLIILAATLSSLGQLLWKFSTESNIHIAIVILLTLSGFICAGLGLVFETIAFRYGQVSILQPMMSISFALSIVWGFLFLDEPVTLSKVGGTCLIILGCILIGSDEGGQLK